MGKFRRLIAAGGQEVLLLPPPPPLQPRPGITMTAASASPSPSTSSQLGGGDYPCCYPFAAVANDAADDVEGHQVKEEAREDFDEPLDYTMKRLASSPSPPASLASVGSASSTALLTLGGATATATAAAMSVLSGGDDLLHKLRNRVLQKRDSSHLRAAATAAAATQVVVPRQNLPFILQRQQQPRHLVASASDVKPTRFLSGSQLLIQAGAQQQQQQPPVDSETEAKAAYAADCIKSRLDGCGKRVHLFLGILLHFGMPPGPDGEQIFERVIAFSDENKNLCDRPTPHFMVLDSKLLALIWCKFKGNSSNEYSTLTRAIRSTRQKYKGIFETVENPGKKLYRFGSVALQQFQQLFPGSYGTGAPVILT